MSILTRIDLEAKPVPVPGTLYQVTEKRFRVGLPPVFRVLFEGQHYTVNHHLLACMERGETPLDLELEPDEAEEAA